MINAVFEKCVREVAEEKGTVSSSKSTTKNDLIIFEKKRNFKMFQLTKQRKKNLLLRLHCREEIKTKVLLFERNCKKFMTFPIFALQ